MESAAYGIYTRVVFHFFNEKKLFEKNFSPRMCAKRRSASCKKRREFWRETHTPLWLLIGRIIFLTCEKTSFAILIGRIIFFTCENHSSYQNLQHNFLVSISQYAYNKSSDHIISYHIISYHIISNRTTSYHISYHIISYHIITYHNIYHNISYHDIYHIISYHIISYHIMPYYIIF